ncbi:TonB-dependent receptor domain-containing protein [Lysobacter sp. CA199]|uniref:TonB-dependent receptor domain-containing protein n=1 Tax=Lysobacter sp. CA199 TaxID=3455608 RepID=UPI003F8D3C2E
MARFPHAWVVLAVLASPLTAGASQAPAGDIPSGDYEIAPGALDDALNAFATRNDLQLIYSPALVARRRSPGLTGNPGIREGLAQLLDGTGLTAVAVRANVYWLQPAPRAHSRQKTDAGSVAPKSPASPKSPTQLDTVHVTGSRIKRAGLESSLPLTLITQEQIRASGHQTLFDVLRLMPGMSGHHPRNIASEGGNSQVPTAAAASASLYSLGPRATLFLVDGRRIANYGLVSTDMGALTDLNGIPLSMVDHIEIARGGASAIYGADAMAGVVNIILKKDYRGVEVGGSYGVSQRGDAEQQRQYASFGSQTRGGGNVFVSVDHFTRNPLIGSQRPWATLDRRRFGGDDRRIQLGFLQDDGSVVPTAGCRHRDPTPAGIECSFDVPRYSSLQPGITSNALYTHLRQPIGENLEFYADLRLSRTGLELRNAPSHGVMPLSADHPDSEELQNGSYSLLNYWFADVGPIGNRVVTTNKDYAIGINGQRNAWSWDLSVSRRNNEVSNRINGLISLSALDSVIDDRSYRFNRVDRNADAVLAKLSPTVVLGGQMSLDTLSGSIDGPLFALPAGEVQVAAGFETRHEHLSNRPDPSLTQGDIALAMDFQRRSDSRNASAVYAELKAPLHDKLWMDAAWRLDRNRGYGDQTSPMFGLRWQPWRSLMLRASAGEGYRAPTLAEQRGPLLIKQQASYYVPVDDSLRPCHQEAYDHCIVDLRARVNAELKPETSTSRNLGLVWTPGDDFSLTANHYRIRRKNEILPINALGLEEISPKALIRDENGELIAVASYLDNVGSTEVRGWEMEAEYRRKTGRWGDVSFRLSGHYTHRLLRRQRPIASVADDAGIEIPNRSVLGDVRWTYRDWIATLNVYYMGPTTVSVPGPVSTFVYGSYVERKRRIPSTTLTGVDLAYGGIKRWLFSVNINNLADRQPGNYNYSSGGYSIADDDPVGRYYLVSAAYRF